MTKENRKEMGGREKEEEGNEGKERKEREGER